MLVDSGVTCMLVCALPLHCTRDRGRIGRPAFPAPSIRRAEVKEYLAQKSMWRDREAVSANGELFEIRICGICGVRARQTQFVVPAPEPGPITTGGRVARKPSNSVS